MEKKEQIDNKIIGQRIRREREKLELTREELAEIVGLSDYYIGQLERGERQMSLSVMVKIANCLHVSLDYLIFGKTPFESYYAHDAHGVYDACGGNKDPEINSLLNKCSPKELELIKKIIKVILPYIQI
ncbi:DNA-binding transcriptional regulator, XRE-family HTH domain [Caldanaerobius fijiensis DSM 17918]|uniref:DNA-binding transcriptional regulator, XRE-family HTH domain n=1 Tax=Caldanaerobius fijiensis DSM 17918 TaxID=1121256 RepID=A0A1M4VJL8_9THEO|nr:helix-turn-helix transcriptional regulator [Caldanaerobius fijiensis]SHE69042.1 DNA-binding transcriptional regulator, XRE-family HTH domain [Caldanaerobius fijiensis DSM 17918]